MWPKSRSLVLSLAPLLLAFLFPIMSAAQTSSTGMLLGIVTDPSSAAVPGATLKLTQTTTNFTHTTGTDSSGHYYFPLLLPGTYELQVSRPGFATLEETGVSVRVSEKTELDIHLKVARVLSSVTVQAHPTVVQTASSALGRVVGGQQIANLPLATRNFTQILGLSPGVTSSVQNAGALGRNSVEVSSNGARFSDNNVQINGADANNILVEAIGDEGAPAGAVGAAQGVAVPAPDSIQEFKVQTGLYDAEYGRNGGANVDLVTKSGTNAFHGDAYEFFRNELLDANDFFRNRAGLDRARLRQNQFGFTLGGPIQRNKTFFFVSYEGNRQSNGVTAGSTSTIFLPPLTNDRSAGMLGKEFGGQKGFFGGVAVAPDGSNINPVALAILNARLPGGQFLIPTPQQILPNGTGESVYSIPARFSENQFNANFDHNFSDRDLFSEKYFFADDSSALPFGGGANVPGFGANVAGRNQNLVLAWRHVFGSALLNDAHFAYTRLAAVLASGAPSVPAGSLGLTAPPTAPSLPNMSFLTFPLSFGNGLVPSGSFINNFQYADSLAWTHGRQQIRMGGEIERQQVNIHLGFDQVANINFFTFPDFLLGLPYPRNGARVPVSDLFVSNSAAGLWDRSQRLNNSSLYFQDDLSVSSRLTLNLGLRYDFFGQVSDALGRLSNFDTSLANQVPPPSGTLSGYVLAQNAVGPTPAGVLRLDRDTIVGDVWGNAEPRFGFAYRPLSKRSIVIRGGYGTYFSQPGTIVAVQVGPNLPFAVIDTPSGAANSNASLQVPFAPTLPPTSAFPLYQLRLPTSNFRVQEVDPHLRPAEVYQWGLNAQYGLADSYLFEVGYLGARGQDLNGSIRFNQPFLVSPSQPFRGVTTNTVANVPMRVPIEGVNPSTSFLQTNGFDSNYHALEATIVKNFNRGFSFQASYTWGHSIDDMVTLPGLLAGGGFLGNVRNFRQNRGSSDFDRRQRFVFNGYWELPRFTTGRALAGVLNGWAFSGIATLQSGLPFSVIDSSAGTAFGATSSRAQLAPGATLGQIELHRSVESRLNGFFNTAAFAPPPVVGSDGVATGFGDSSRNIIRGPNQQDIDFAAIRRFPAGWPTDEATVTFRAEFYNAFNLVNFANPGNNRASAATLGVISGTTVAPRIIQFALKFNF